MQYEMSDEEYGSKEGEDSWVQALLAHLGHHLHTLQPLLTPSNFEHLVPQLLEKASTSCLDGVTYGHTCFPSWINLSASLGPG